MDKVKDSMEKIMQPYEDHTREIERAMTLNNLVCLFASKSEEDCLTAKWMYETVKKLSEDATEVALGHR